MQSLAPPNTEEKRESSQRAAVREEEVLGVVGREKSGGGKDWENRNGVGLGNQKTGSYIAGGFIISVEDPE